MSGGNKDDYLIVIEINVEISILDYQSIITMII